MNIIVRFYWQHDIDLVALKMHPDFDMSRQMKRAVIAYARGDGDFSIPLPRSMPYRVELDNCSIHFRLNPGEDDDVIAVMNGFRSGFRNSALKNIFRQYLEGSYMEPFFNEQTYISKTRVPNSGATEKTSIRPSDPMKKAHVPATPSFNADGKTDMVEEAHISSDYQSEDMKDLGFYQDEPEDPDVSENIVSAKTNSMPDDPVMDLAEEDTGYEDGDTFDIFGAVDSLINQ